MKLDARTTQILKNFATINPSMLFRSGKEQSTIAPQKNLLARATVTESFPQEFAIFDVSRFMGVLSLFNEPELEFASAKMTIRQGRQKVDYTFADPELIVSAPQKTPDIGTPEVIFMLPAEQLSATIKALGVLQSSHIIVQGDGETISIGTGKPSDPTSDQFRLEVASSSSKFVLALKADAVKVLPGSYQVSISPKKIAHFKADDVEYWVMADVGFSNFD
jgi:hypothetical protein